MLTTPPTDEFDSSLCEGCAKPLNPIDRVQGYRVCLGCTKARARSAMDHRCHCGRQVREDPRERKTGSRRWYECQRCLGTTRQVA